VSGFRLLKFGVFGLNFGFWHPADQMGLHILWFGIGRVVDVTADVEIVVVLVGDFRLVDEAAVFEQLTLMREYEIDLLDIFRSEFVLVGCTRPPMF
jgi:hypothetical protein